MKRIGLDVETSLDHKTIWTVKTIDLDTGEIRTWKEANSLKEFVKGCTLISGHNIISFDSKILRTVWNIKINLKMMYDTLVVSRLLEPSRENGHSLESWGEALGTRKTSYSKIWQWMMGRREEYKNECFDNPIMPLLEYYCEGDVKVLRALFLHLESERERLEFSEESVELEHQVAYIIAEQEENGFKLNVPYATCLLTDWKTRISDLVERAQELYPPVIQERYSERTGKRLKDSVVVFNIGSRQQIAEKLQALGWRPEKHTEKGNIIVDEPVLEEILKQCS
jgi:DNA polymerase I-like protein with 3'-5' exonuclease and polymerase domains